jgi:single-stranded DNA-binding protein
MNTVHLIGTIKFAPRLNFTFNSGKSKATAIIACQAEGRQYPDNVDVAAWDDAALTLADCLQGQEVEIHGRVTTESWDDKETGKKRYKMLVIAKTVKVVGALPPSEEELPF